MVERSGPGVTQRRADVVVVGGGMVGIATAWALARAGASVTLVERDGLAGHASGRNQGLLTAPHPPPLRAIAAAGLAGYEELHDRSGGAFFLDRSPHGCLLVGAGDLTGAALAAEEPQLGPSVTAAALEPDARRVDPGALAATLAAEAIAAGVEVRTGAEVRELLWDGDRTRVRGVRTDTEAIPAGTVVVAGGPWSWRICRSGPFDVPVHGVRGWLVVTRPAPFRLRHAIEDSDWDAAKAALRPATVAELAGLDGCRPPGPAIAGLVQQDPAGRLLLGASLQVSPTDHPEGQAEAVAGVCRRAAELVPAVAGLAVVEVRTCRRPLSADGLPLHGPVPGVDGLVLATGHGSKGIAWGLGSGLAVSAGILDGAWVPELLPERFAR
ncbi:MAG: FAD-dependent oxidoreductase [Acidimicrobiales bacterium]